MVANISNNYGQFYRGTEQIASYGSGAGKKDTIVRYEFNTIDEKGNKVMDKMTKEETFRTMNEISSQYGDNVIVEFSGDALTALEQYGKGLLGETAADREPIPVEYLKEYKAAQKAEAEEVKSGKFKLSDKAAAFLENLRKTYGDFDFIVGNSGDDLRSLVKNSSKEFSVVFSTEELERMAVDEKYAEEKMNAVQSAVRMSLQINEQFGFESAFGKNTEGVKMTKFGICFNDDGSVSYFAELEKSSQKQKERIEQMREKRSEEKKEAARKEKTKEDKEDTGSRLDYSI